MWFIGTFPEGMQLRKELYGHAHTLSGSNGSYCVCVFVCVCLCVCVCLSVCPHISMSYTRTHMYIQSSGGPCDAAEVPRFLQGGERARRGQRCTAAGRISQHAVTRRIRQRTFTVVPECLNQHALPVELAESSSCLQARFRSGHNVMAM